MSADLEKGFYIVWNPTGRNPQYRHASYDAARTEAQRLARQNHGQQFFLLGAMNSYQANDLSVVTYDTTFLEIPF